MLPGYNDPILCGNDLIRTKREGGREFNTSVGIMDVIVKIKNPGRRPDEFLIASRSPRYIGFAFGFWTVMVFKF